MTIYAITLEEKSQLRSWFFLTREAAEAFIAGIHARNRRGMGSYVLCMSSIEMGKEHMHTEFGFETPEAIREREAEFEREINGEDE